MSIQPCKVRFAPSPTGLLHAGNVRTAVINWLFARANGGIFLLRLDDTDTERSSEEFANGIYEDLRWLGLEWDEFAQQSARNDQYDAAVAHLKSIGRLYACYETSQELELKRKVQLSRGLPPIYDRAGLALSAADHERLQASGLQPHWRFLLDDTSAVSWDDLGRGVVHFEPGHLSDPVLLRGDGRPLYTLTSVVDDKELRVSHIIRGADHIANTAVQCQLFEALDAPVPTMAHLPLMVGQDGHNLSKRLQSLSAREMRQHGIMPRALGLYLGSLGMSTAPQFEWTMPDFAKHFDLANFGKASARFDDGELHHWNAKVLHTTPLDALQPIFEKSGIGQIDADGWMQIQTHIQSIGDVKAWWPVYYNDDEFQKNFAHEFVCDEKTFIAQAADLLPDTLRHADHYHAWIDAIKQATGAKGKSLFLPLRMALTGQASGPELAQFTCFLGRDRTKARMEAISHG